MLDKYTLGWKKWHYIIWLMMMMDIYYLMKKRRARSPNSVPGEGRRIQPQDRGTATSCSYEVLTAQFHLNMPMYSPKKELAFGGTG